MSDQESDSGSGDAEDSESDSESDSDSDCTGIVGLTRGRCGLVFEHVNKDEALFFYQEIFVRQEYTRVFSTSALSAAGLIVDAGANIGLFSLFCLAEYRSRLVAVEASSKLCSVLARNLLGKGDFRVVHACLGDKPKTTELYYFPDMPGESTRHLAEHHEQRQLLHQGPLNHETEVVVCATLERVLNVESGPIVLLKVDVEGDELVALKGLGSVWPRVRHCAVEVQNPAL